MFTHNLEAEQKLNAMPKIWQRFGGSTNKLFDEICQADEILTLTRQGSRTNIQRASCVPPPESETCSPECEGENDLFDFQEPTTERRSDAKSKLFLALDASSLNDLPCQYTICALEPHQLPVVGIYVDKRVVPGFKYKVRPLPAIGRPSTTYNCLFNDKALTLLSIGRGYSRRLTFNSDNNEILKDTNYFWSDNRPEGYAFELEVVSVGDKFTIYDVNNAPQGTLEVLKLEGFQVEISSDFTNEGMLKRAKVKFIGKVEMYETGVAKPKPVTGIASVLKRNGSVSAKITKVSVIIGSQKWYLIPGIQNIHRRITVRGEDISDVPTKYTMNGLETYEFPVVGTYVHPSIMPGFNYRIRPNNRRSHLFGGRTLPLLSIGMGYAKRLTFQADSAVESNNYLWSDNHPDGLGLEPRAVETNMRFVVKSGKQVVGEAKVFRDDRPQIEENMEKIPTTMGVVVQKYIHIDVMCHIRLVRTGGASTENEEHLMRVSGLAVVRKEPNAKMANVIRVDNIGLDSQLAALFLQTHTELTFVPVD